MLSTSMIGEGKLSYVFGIQGCNTGTGYKVKGTGFQVLSDRFYSSVILYASSQGTGYKVKGKGFLVFSDWVFSL